MKEKIKKLLNIGRYGDRWDIGHAPRKNILIAIKNLKYETSTIDGSLITKK